MELTQPPLLEYLTGEGFTKDGLFLLLQENGLRVLGIFQRAGGVGRDQQEPDLMTPATFLLRNPHCLISLSLEVPTLLSERYLCVYTAPNAHVRPWHIQAPQPPRRHPREAQV